jgi:nitrite reductase/ring-hydroxylating ferredoxin subunit/DMSO/TMAO reductase YedYZ heme-binding membrane subunit
MSVGYVPVLWNRNKKIYDRILLIGIVCFLLVYSSLYLWLHPNGTIETLIIRSTGILAFLMLHFILSIGPLSRIYPSLLPLLYNRRHFGVLMFLVAAIHGIFNLIQFHALGNTDILSSLFTSNQHYTAITQFPFQVLGFFALIILFLMAATSHDFWLKNLSPVIWKSLHMLVYLAYGFIVMHVMLGVAQDEPSWTIPIVVAAGFISMVSLHLISRGFENTRNVTPDSVEQEFIPLCHVDEITENRAKVFMVVDQNIAVFKYDNKLSAINNVCKHQLGPLGEGKIIDGCITCPWHGYQYHPDDGCSPPPFQEKVTTYKLRLKDKMIYVNPKPLEEGTYVEPVIMNHTTNE